MSPLLVREYAVTTRDDPPAQRLYLAPQLVRLQPTVLWNPEAERARAWHRICLDVDAAPLFGAGPDSESGPILVRLATTPRPEPDAR